MTTNSDERSALLHFLAANRAAVLAVVRGLSENHARLSVVPSAWTPLTMMIHLGGVERHWFYRTLGRNNSDTPALVDGA